MANDNASRAYAEITLVRPPAQPTLYERILRPFFPGYVARRIRRRHLFEACEAGLRRYAARPEKIAKWDGFDGRGPRQKGRNSDRGSGQIRGDATPAE